jgi:hypothetical protein
MTSDGRRGRRPIEMTRSQRKMAIAHCGLREHVVYAHNLIISTTLFCGSFIAFGAHQLAFGEGVGDRGRGAAMFVAGAAVAWPFLLYLRRPSAPLDDGDLAAAMRAVRVHRNGPDDWWAECLACRQWTATNCSTERQARERFGRHLWNDPHPMP